MRTPEFYYRNSLAAALRGDISDAQELKELGDVRRESFGLSFSEGASEEYPFIEEALETLLNSYEFTRCQRPDGSFYGTRGKCRKGAEAGAKEKSPEGSGKATQKVKAGTEKEFRAAMDNIQANELKKQKERQAAGKEGSPNEEHRLYVNNMLSGLKERGFDAKYLPEKGGFKLVKPPSSGSEKGQKALKVDLGRNKLPKEVKKEDVVMAIKGAVRGAEKDLGERLSEKSLKKLVSDVADTLRNDKTGLYRDRKSIYEMIFDNRLIAEMGDYM
jgi:hypothetical protein